MKRCSHCRCVKPLDEFHRHANARDGSGRANMCRECTRESQRRNRTLLCHRDRSHDRTYYQTHKAEYLANSSRWRKSTPRGRYDTTRTGARNRGLPFLLTFEQFSAFWQKPCHYCGGLITTIGLDRVDSSKGYFVDNVVPCCEVCNIIKSTLPVDAWLSHLRRIVAKADGLDVDPNAKRPALNLFTWRTKRASA